MRIGILCQHRSGHSAYEQHLANITKIKVVQELNLNHKDVDTYMQNLPKTCIFSMMPRVGIDEIMRGYKDINWRVLLRRDFVRQCISFVYTNRSQIFAGEQNKKLLVDPNLIDSFFDNFQIISKIVKTKKYPVYFYEDLDLSRAFDKKNSTQYEKLILNIDEVTNRISAKKNQLSL